MCVSLRVCVCMDVHVWYVCDCIICICEYCKLIYTLKLRYIFPGSTATNLTSPSNPRCVGHSDIRQIEAQPQLLIDRIHPVVQQLCSAGFTEEQSIDAVKKYGTLDKAMDYLMSIGVGEEETATTCEQDSLSSDETCDMEPLDPP